MEDVKTWMDRLIMCALWILATTAGVTVGFNIARFMSFGGEGGPIVFWGLLTAGSLEGGAIIGLLQWLVLHRWFKNVGWWIAGTAVGFVLLHSCWLIGLPPPFYRILLAREVFPFVFWGVMGLLQWLVLRKKLSRAAWWVPASMLGWGVGQFIISLSMARYSWGLDLSFSLSSSLSGVVVGITTGVALVLLVTQERQLPNSAKRGHEDQIAGTRLPEVKPARWQWMALAVVLSLLIPGEFAFQWAKRRGWVTYTEDDGLAGNIVDSIAIAPDGTLWFGTGWGVSSFDGETWVTYDRIDMPTSSIPVVALAPDGALWLGSYYGVSRFDGDSCTTYTTCTSTINQGLDRPGLEPNWVQAIAVARDGVVWFNTPGLEDRGVCRFDGEIWTTYTTDDGLVSNSVQCIAVAPDGAVWFGTGGGVSRFDGENWTTYTAQDGLANNFATSIAVAPDGTLWFGVGDGVSRFDGENWTTYTTADGSWVESIAVGPDGVLWLYAGQGVSRFDGQTWVTYTPANSGLAGLARGSPRGLAVDNQGRVWVGTWNGLSVLDERVSLPARPLHVLAAVWSVVRVALGTAVFVLLTIVWIALRRPKAARGEGTIDRHPSITLWVLGAGLVLSLCADLAVLKLTGQVWPLTYLVPINLVLLLSLFASFIAYVAKREWTMVVACIVLVLAALAYLVLFLSGFGLGFAY